MTQTAALAQVIKDTLGSICGVETQFDWSHYREDLTYYSPQGYYTSIEETQELLAGWVIAFPDLRVDVIDLSSYGDVVSVEASTKGTHLGDFFGVPASNNTFELPNEIIYVFDHAGMITQITSIFDFQNLLEQLNHTHTFATRPKLEETRKQIIEKLKSTLRENFTTREIECFALYLLNFSYKQIGNAYSISPRTVETHIQNGLSKLGCTSHSQAIEHMQNRNLVPLWTDLNKTLLQA